MATAANDMETLKAEVTKFIQALPQAKFMSSARIQTWINDTVTVEGDRLAWHAKRLKGFGGSEMGALVNSFFGRNNFRSSAEQIVAGKLCMVPPSPGDEHTARGTYGEAIARDRFEAWMTSQGLKFERLEDLQKNVIEGRSNPVRPWRVSSLDDLYKVEVEPDTWEVWLVDEKCPSSDMIQKYETQFDKIAKATGLKGRFGHFVPCQAKREIAGYDSGLLIQDYSHQLHHYLQDARDKGVHVDRIFLAPLNWDFGAKVVPVEIEIDDRVMHENNQAGDHYYDNCLMQGIVPDPDHPEVVEAEDLPPELLRKVEAFISYQAMVKAAKPKAEELKVEIERDVAALGRFDGDTLKISGTTIKREVSLDEAKIIDCLSSHGWSEEAINELRKPGKYDTKRMTKRWPHVLQDFRSVLDGAVRSDRAQLIETLKGMRESLQYLPQIEPGPFDAEKVEEALLSCKQNIRFFRTETLTLSETRKTSTERDLIKDVVAELLPKMMEQVEARLENEEHEQRPQNGLS